MTISTLLSFYVFLVNQFVYEITTLTPIVTVEIEGIILSSVLTPTNISKTWLEI